MAGADDKTAGGKARRFFVRSAGYKAQKPTSGAKKPGKISTGATLKKGKLSNVVNGGKNDISKSTVDAESEPGFDATTFATFPLQGEQQPERLPCKHCKKWVDKKIFKDHCSSCLKVKQEKARKKKEAREAAQRAKERAERGDDDDDDDDDDIRDGKSKKRKAEDDDKDKEPKKKKKKDEPKAKAAKAKGPVDVEKQCGVILPNGAQCARSLTCKSHSMGAKRAVGGRSLPYDMLLQNYQKKNQARQQKAAIDANAPLQDEDLDATLNGPVDSDEERDSVMTAIARSLARPQPLYVEPDMPLRRKYQLVRMKEMLRNAINGNRSGNMFAVPRDLPPTGPETFAVPASASSAMPTSAGIAQPGKIPNRKQSVDPT